MRPPKTLAQLDDLALAAEGSGHHADLAERLLAGADQLPVGAALRAEVLVAAAEQLQLSGQPERSVATAEAAVADGGVVRYGARAHLSSALRGAGRHAEARAVLAEVRRERPVAPGLHLFAGEQYEAMGDLAEALRWYTRGLAIAERRVSEDGELMCLRLLVSRHRLRHELGLPHDDWDDAAADLVAEARRSVDWQESGAPALPGNDVAVVLGQEDGICVLDLVAH